MRKKGSNALFEKMFGVLGKAIVKRSCAVIRINSSFWYCPKRSNKSMSAKETDIYVVASQREK